MDIKRFVANPPEPLSRQVCDYSIFVRAGGEGEVWMVAVPVLMVMDMAAVDMAAEPGRIAMPMAPAVYADNTEAYIDYESALAAVTPPGAVARAPAFCTVVHGALMVDLSGLTPVQRRGTTLTLCDLTGRVVARVSGERLATCRLTLALRDFGLPPGSYTLRLSGPGVAYSRQVAPYSRR